MVNYNRLGYELKRDLANFSLQKLLKPHKYWISKMFQK